VSLHNCASKLADLALELLLYAAHGSTQQLPCFRALLMLLLLHAVGT
jgi:hypothetical protein